MHDHYEYSVCYFEDEEEEYLDDRSNISNENSINSINTYMKHGDELLIDMVRSRPYLYDKMVHDYKDAQMKENAWTEIAIALNITCNYRMQESLVTSSLTIQQGETVAGTRDEKWSQKVYETKSSISSLRQTSASDIERSAMVSPSCFSGKQQRAFKKRKIDPVETAFYQMNNTLSTMADKVCSRRTLVNDNDADVLIGKLITAELQRTIEPHKSELKQKLMEFLYFSKPSSN
ncbi:hypothetical protein ALC62_09309 [Cyphomyrmex costatus]|uniref:MADF domain-containing protein n=1 Tax=Cyphomyrmex costatus TaxID=456900 RepID=A0A151IFG7_9HYME|nr:hypothetical protein ALC62_09309 [Cyphomyrmex costatus]